MEVQRECVCVLLCEVERTIPTHLMMFYLYYFKSEPINIVHNVINFRNPVHVIQPPFCFEGSINAWYISVNNVCIALVAFSCTSRLILALKRFVYM